MYSSAFKLKIERGTNRFSFNSMSYLALLFGCSSSYYFSAEYSVYHFNVIIIMLSLGILNITHLKKHEKEYHKFLLYLLSLFNYIVTLDIQVQAHESWEGIVADGMSET